MKYSMRLVAVVSNKRSTFFIGFGTPLVHILQILYHFQGDPKK